MSARPSKRALGEDVTQVTRFGKVGLRVRTNNPVPGNLELWKMGGRNKVDSGGLVKIVTEHVGAWPWKVRLT